MRHYTLASILAFLYISGCSPQHPTLDDFLIEDDIVLETQDLLSEREAGLEVETDAEGALVASHNPEDKPEIHLASRTLQAKNKPYTQKFNPNDIALHLTGQSVNKNESTTPHLKALHEYKNSLQTIYSSYEMRNLSKMRTWRENFLTSVPKPTELLYYPFSGPDVVNMLTLFPDHPTYVMMGLEYVGTSTSLDEWSKPLDKTHMDSMQKAIASVFLRSFFRTLNMSSDFSKNGTHGVLPGMLLMLKLMNIDILDVQWVNLSPEGAIKYLSADESKQRNKNFGVELTIKQSNVGYNQRIYYFKTDLSDSEISKNAPLSRFVSETLGETTTLIKSASFLMHMKEFKWIRQTLLSISREVLQDDSGIPFKFYLKSLWQQQLFGRYTGPYGESFVAFQQPDLLKAYEAAYPKLLDFHFGYGYAKIPSHLILMIRKEP